MRWLHWLALGALAACLGCSAGGGTSAATTGGAATDTAAPVVAETPAPTVTETPAPAGVDDQQLRASMAAAGVVAAQTPVQDPELVALGQALMFDKILSGNKDVSCATCHHPTQHTGDGLSLSIGTGGVGLGPTRQLGAGRPFIPRNAMDLFNRANVPVMFLDGRVRRGPQGTFQTPAGAQLPPGLQSTLAAQAMFPVTSRDEMRGQVGDLAADGTVNELAVLADDDFTGIWAGLMARLTANPQYVALFDAAFPGVPTNQLGFQHAANAIGAFEASQFASLDSPFDRYVAGDNAALTEAQKRGAVLFFGTARCSVCHRGGLLSDFAFHDVAFPQVGPGKGAEAPLDFGLGRETGNVADRFKFRTAPLHNVALTGPWTHAGGYTTLEAVVRHYINPAQAMQSYDPTQLDPRLQGQVHVQDTLAAGVLENLDPALRPPLQLSDADVADVVEFLNALTDPAALDMSQQVPASVPSGLSP
ncbi:MAG: cytochrome c peroxidase [Candidatus Eremiobacterota bacterium]